MNWRKTGSDGRTIVWCKTQQEVDDFMDIAEYEGVEWGGSLYATLRSHTEALHPNVEYHIFPDNKLYYDPGIRQRKHATILGSELHNYAISVRLKRGGTRD